MSRFIRKSGEEVPPKNAGLERARLHFAEVQEVSEELAISVQLVRDRVIDLQRKFRGDARRAIRWFHRSIFVSFSVSICAISIGFVFEQELAGGIAVALGILAATVAAFTQALGWHTRYKSMFAATWEMNALRLRIDHSVLSFAMRLDENGCLSESDKSVLTKEIETWIKSIEISLSKFGDSYGSSFNTPKLPKFVL